MSDINTLLHRYLEDRASLAAGELDELIAALRADPELASNLREQLVLDDMLAQKLALDRRNFVAQVEQRIADLNRGHNELNRQVADLRSIAAAEKPGSRSVSAHWQWTRYVLALLALVAIGLMIFAVRKLDQQPVIAIVKTVEGEVTVGREGDTEAAKVDGELESGQRIVVPRGGLIIFAYQDGTELRVKGDSEVTFGAEQPGTLKEIRIERGEVVANVKVQAAGPMRFTTPHAVAAAPASVLRLVVTEENTLLDVSEGQQVKFDRLSDNRSLTVAANESGMASRDTLQLRQLTWPNRRDGLAYLFSPLESAPKEYKPLTVVRNPETRSLRSTPLEPRGAAALSESRWFYELNGGYLFSGDAGPDIFAASRGGSELTLEAVFSPASMDQTGPARILSVCGDSEEPNFALEQDGSEFMVSLRTDAKTPPASPPKLTINSADTPLHLTLTYRDRELIAYRDGMEIARSDELWGSLATWRSGPLTVGADASGERPWRGIMEALALYNRCLEPGEVARNARNYRLLSRREM